MDSTLPVIGLSRRKQEGESDLVTGEEEDIYL